MNTLSFKPREMIRHGNYCALVQRKSFSRTVAIRVEPNGSIVVTGSKTNRLKGLGEYFVTHLDWVKDGIRKAEDLGDQFPPFIWKFGGYVPFLGEFCEIRRGSHKLKYIEWSEGVFWVSFPNSTPSQACFRNLFRSYYEKVARSFLRSRLEIFSKQMQVSPKRISFRSQKTRWGSCSSEGNISLNWKIIAAPKEVIDYLVVHELAHLRFMDHSENFWNFVEEFSPRNKVCRRWLSANQYAFDFLETYSELHSCRLPFTALRKSKV